MARRKARLDSRAHATGPILRATLFEIEVLLTITDRDALLRHAVEFARGTLGAERCSIYLKDPDADILQGSFGTDDRGRTTDERAVRVPTGELSWADMQARVKAGAPQWSCKEGEYVYFDGAWRTTSRRGWLATTPIAAGSRLIGLMYNDRALTGAPFDEELQDQLAVFCSLLGHLLLRRETERELENERTLLRTLIDNLPDAVYIKDLQRRFVAANVAVAHLMERRTPAQLLGKRDEDFYAPDVAAMYAADEERMFRSGEAMLNKEEPLQFPGGRPRAILTTKVPLKNPQGEVTGLVGIGRDITDLQAAQAERRLLVERMQQVQKLESLGVLAGGIAHDFNNLLTAILGNADLALADMSNEAPGRACLEEIIKVSRQAADLCRHMLAYSGKGKFVMEPLDLSRLVDEMAHMLEISVSKRATLQYNITHGLPSIEGDATQIRQVVMNLIINASEAIAKPGGVIAISTGVEDYHAADLADAFLDQNLPAGTYVYLEVADSGCGMDPATIARIFDPFFTTKFTGRGLGLAAVQGIVRGHHGTIKVRSEPGRGTTFKMLLPASGRSASKDPPPQADAVAQERCNGIILVVDDEANVRSIARRMLEGAGYTVVTAQDGIEAVELFQKASARFDAVLLDLTMPRREGAETLRLLRALDPDVRVVLTSGYNEQDATQPFRGQRLAGFLQKPFQRHQLLATLRAAVRPPPPT